MPLADIGTDGLTGPSNMCWLELVKVIDYGRSELGWNAVRPNKLLWVSMKPGTVAFEIDVMLVQG